MAFLVNKKTIPIKIDGDFINFTIRKIPFYVFSRIAYLEKDNYHKYIKKLLKMSVQEFRHITDQDIEDYLDFLTDFQKHIIDFNMPFNDEELKIVESIIFNSYNNSSHVIQALSKTHGDLVLFVQALFNMFILLADDKSRIRMNYTELKKLNILEFQVLQIAQKILVNDYNNKIKNLGH